MRDLKFTLKAWPVIAAATIGLCYLTQTVAGWFGVELPDQQNIDLVRRCAGWNWNFVWLCFQVLVVMPAAEEAYFRHFLYRRSLDPVSRKNLLFALVPTAAILALGGLLFLHPFVRGKVAAPIYFGSLALFSVAEYPLRVFGFRLVARLAPVAAALLSAVLFSAAHYLAQPFPDAAFIALFFFGFAQCWLYRKTGHLWCAILNHGLFNLTNLVLLFVIPQS